MSSLVAQWILTWPGRGHFVMFHGEPVLTGGSLLLELTLECRADVLESEGAHGGATDGVGGRGEGCIDNVLDLITITTLDRSGDILDLVKVERIVSWH